MMTRMPSAVATSVRMTVRITPTRSAMRPQRNLPAAPPTKSRPSAVPIPATVELLAMSAKGRNVMNPVRVELSIIPIAARALKPRGSRMPQPVTRSPPPFSSGVAPPAPSRRRTISRAPATRSPSRPYVAPAASAAPPRAPPADGRRAKGDEARARGFPAVPREVVGAERRAAPAVFVGFRDQRRRQRVLHARAEAGGEQDDEQRQKAAGRA